MEAQSDDLLVATFDGIPLSGEWDHCNPFGPTGVLHRSDRDLLTSFSGLEAFLLGAVNKGVVKRSRAFDLYNKVLAGDTSAADEIYGILLTVRSMQARESRYG